MGLGPPKRDYHERPSNSFHYWIAVFLLAFLLGLAVLATAASAYEVECWKWPCFKDTDKSRNHIKRRKKPAHKHIAKTKARTPKKHVTRISGFALKPDMIRALVRQESGGHCCRRSRAGALGKYQIMPRTARKWARASGHSYLRRASYRRIKRALYTPSIAIDIAKAYINYYKRRYGHDEIVLIAYNGGPKRARQANYCLKRYGYLCVYRRETYNYVRSIFRMAGRRPMKMVCKCGRRRR